MAKMGNLVTRTITGVLFVAVIVCGIWLGPITFGLVFAIVTALSVWEFTGIVNEREDVQVNQLISTVAGTYLFFAIGGYCMGIVPSSVFVPYLLSVIYLFISELYLKRPCPLNNWAFSCMSQLYVALPFALLGVLAFQANQQTGETAYHRILPLAVFLFLWANDTGAYCFGSLLGRHKLFPRISPHKSWEGSAGGALVAVGVSQLIAFSVPEAAVISPLQWLGLAMVVVLFGTWGDLVESLLKRQMGIKDSGTILPGHGGMLDRFDSALIAIPAAVVYLYTISLF